MADRYVVVGLARSRCRWFGELARWATAGVAPIEFVKCLTSDEVRAVIGAGRPVSALLVDAGLTRLDRDLVEAAADAGAPTILVGPSAAQDWEALGCTSALDADFSRDQLVETLDRWARRVDRSTARPPRRIDLQGPVPRAPLVGVTGAGGTGASVVAMALAQAAAEEGTDTVLVDGCRRADLAMYHDIGDVLPGLPELVDVHRTDDADPDLVRSVEFPVAQRGYRILLGIRRARDWAGLRPRAIDAAIDGLRRTHGMVVIDHDPDLEREVDTGSVDVEDRHAVALHTAARADAVVVVVEPGLKGLHDAVRIIDDLCRVGVAADAILPVLNRAPRSAPARAQLARALRALTVERTDGAARVAAPVFVPHHRSLEGCHRTAAALPASLTRVVWSGVSGRLARPAARTTAGGPESVRPGDLGTRIDLTPQIRGDVA